MKLSEFKNTLNDLSEMMITLPNGGKVLPHFHITEVGQVEKKFIDCGGVIRNETKVSFQLWENIDINHRLEPRKIINIIELSERKIGVQDHEIEVEYQGETIGKYGIAFDGQKFNLTNTQTTCLAEDSCGIPVQKSKNACPPNSNCC